MEVAGALGRLDGNRDGEPHLVTCFEAIVAEAKRAGRTDGGNAFLRTGGDACVSRWCRQTTR